jgi:hypothetical protein
MSFGGHLHKAASDQLQKKLQEAMGDDPTSWPLVWLEWT